jgi:carbonic anhydrase
MISAAEALDRLMQGNRRFVSDQAVRDSTAQHLRRMELLEEQHPFAIVLGCSDSRVPAELVFDQAWTTCS